MVNLEFANLALVWFPAGQSINPDPRADGPDVLKCITTPMVGGVITSIIMELAVYPAIHFLWRSRGLERRTEKIAAD